MQAMADAVPVSIQSSVASSWLAPLVALSTEGVSAQQSNEDRTGIDPDSPIFKKLLAGILYSRWLSFTYYGVVAACLIIFIVANWGPRLKTWYKSRAQAQTRRLHNVAGVGTEHEGLKSALVSQDSRDDAFASGSSSPVRATQTTDEQTPLLHQQAGRGSHQGLISAAFNKVSSWLTYQPKSLPGFGNRVMPSNATTVLILIYLGISLFYLLVNIEFSVPTIFILADRASQLFVVNLPVLYVLSAKNQPLQPLIGYSYASLNIAHRRLGESMCLLAAVHGVGMITMWATLLWPNGYTPLRFFGDSVILLGLGALFCYEALYFTSLATVRQQAYELFLATHVLLQVGALGFLFFHHSKSTPYVLISVGIWAMDRIVYRLCTKTNTFKAALRVLPDGQTIRVSVSMPLTRPNLASKLLGLRSVRNGWQTLDHVFLNIPALAHKHVLQSHPFSIASTTPSPDAHSADLELIIRARDGFSKDLLVYAAEHDTVNVRIDGPYGAHSASRLLHHSDARIIVAGGSGIAVTYPLLNQLLNDEDSEFDDVEHAAHTEAVRPILFIWVVHSKEQWAWIDFDRLKALGSRVGVEIITPEPTNEAGRPDLSGVLGRWVRAGKGTNSVGVVVSGPDGMSREVRNECASLQALGLDVHVEVEKYGW